MIAHLLKQKVTSQATKSKITHAICAGTALLILVLGFQRLPELELTEGQILLGAFGIFTLALQCIILSLLVDLRQRLRRAKDE